MTPPQDIISTLESADTYASGTSPATEWSEQCEKQIAHAKALISQLSIVQHDIETEKTAIAERNFQGIEQLLALFKRADELAQNRMCDDAYRAMWANRYYGTAQFWETLYLKGVARQIFVLVILLGECERDARQLSEFVKKDRKDLWGD